MAESRIDGRIRGAGTREVCYWSHMAGHGINPNNGVNPNNILECKSFVRSNTSIVL
jgi:hypothetical protein